MNEYFYDDDMKVKVAIKRKEIMQLNATVALGSDTNSAGGDDSALSGTRNRDSGQFPRTDGTSSAATRLVLPDAQEEEEE